MPSENLTFAYSRIGPLETSREYLPDIGQIEEEEGDPNDRIHDGDDLPDGGDWYHVSIP